ncbi:MAG: hypothetical protein ABI854_05955 [Betaproteobacteria bacterium]
MKTNRQWQSGNWLDGMMNVLVIVLALGMLGAGAFQAEPTTTQLTANTTRVA